jgi:hypothetical protein
MKKEQEISQSKGVLQDVKNMLCKGFANNQVETTWNQVHQMCVRVMLIALAKSEVICFGSTEIVYGIVLCIIGRVKTMDSCLLFYGQNNRVLLQPPQKDISDNNDDIVI